MIQKRQIQPLLLLSFFLLYACGSGGGGEVLTPTVAETTPSNQATNVPVDSTIRAKFSTKIDPATVNDKNFFVLDTAGPMAGSVTYQDQTAVFAPSQPFGKGRQYNVVLTTGIKDLDGIPLRSNFTWSFVTEGEGGTDTTPPTIQTTVPARDASNVSNTAPIMVVFSEAIDPNTINAGTFFIQGVTGTYSYDQQTQTAKLVPSALALSTTYSVTVTTGIKDLAGNPLAQGTTWSFKTVRDITPPQIKEKSPGENVTEVPVNTNVSVTFDEQVDRTKLQSRFILTGPSGTIPADFSYDVGSMTATLNPTADLDGGTKFQVFLKSGVEDISGNATSSDASWFFTTGDAPDTTPPLVTEEIPKGDGIFVKSLITARFSELINSNTLAGNFIVSGPSGNVPGEVRYENGIAIFTPSSSSPSGPRLEYSTTYTVLLRSGIRDRAGNPLTDTSWTFTTIDPPRVTDKSPEGQGISTDPPAPIRVTFSREMKGSSLNQSSFVVSRTDSPSGGIVTGAISYANAIATFTPTIPFSDNTVYRVTLTTAIEDVNGNPLPSEVTWTFQTASPPDPAPRVVSTAPDSGAIGVSVNISQISAQFARPIDSSSLAGQFAVRETNGVCCLGGRLDYDVAQQRALFFPKGALAYNTSYTVVLGAGVRSSAGTPMGSDYTWSFTTEAAPDTTLPSVVGSDPADGARDVPAADLSGQPFSIRVDFSEPVAPATVHAATFTVRKVMSDFDKPQLSGTYRFESSSVFFDPSSPYERGRTYQVTLSTGITDLAGNHLPFDVVISFSTAP